MRMVKTLLNALMTPSLPGRGRQATVRPVAAH